MSKLYSFVIARYKWLSAAASLTASSFFLSPVYAQEQLAEISSGAKTFVDRILCPLFSTMFYVLISLSVIMVIWAGYIYLIAQDDPEKITKARKTITYAALAVVVALIAQGFPNVIASVFPSLSSGNVLGVCP